MRKIWICVVMALTLAGCGLHTIEDDVTTQEDNTPKQTQFDRRVRAAWADAAQCGGYVEIRWNRTTQDLRIDTVNCDT